MIQDTIKSMIRSDIYQKLQQYSLLYDLVNKDRFVIVYKTVIKQRLKDLVNKGYFEQFEIPYWSYIWGHKYKYSYREAVKQHSMQITTDNQYEAEFDVDRYNPKYNLVLHLLYDAILSGFKDEQIIV